MLVKMFVEVEGGVAVVRNNSNSQQPDYISSKKPLTLLLNSAQTIKTTITNRLLLKTSNQTTNVFTTIKKKI